MEVQIRENLFGEDYIFAISGIDDAAKHLKESNYSSFHVINFESPVMITMSLPEVIEYLEFCKWINSDYQVRMRIFLNTKTVYILV